MQLRFHWAYLIAAIDRASRWVYFEVQPDKSAATAANFLDFDQTCAAHGIDHRLIKPGHPQTNGMIERFNGRAAEMLKTTTFASARHLETTLQKYFTSIITTSHKRISGMSPRSPN